jgi:hypothetical protein
VVGIEYGAVSGVTNLESPGVEAWLGVVVTITGLSSRGGGPFRLKGWPYA